MHELRLTVPNRPGIVAQVALALGRAGVNIVDMALAPAPDMRSGAMTLWIAGDAGRARATELIEELGLPRRERERVSATPLRPRRPAARADYTPPADKSISHRAALFAAMCDEPVTVRNYLDAGGHALDARRPAGARRGVEDERHGDAA